MLTLFFIMLFVLPALAKTIEAPLCCIRRRRAVNNFRNNWPRAANKAQERWPLSDEGFDRPMSALIAERDRGVRFVP